MLKHMLQLVSYMYHKDTRLSLSFSFAKMLQIKLLVTAVHCLFSSLLPGASGNIYMGVIVLAAVWVGTKKCDFTFRSLIHLVICKEYFVVFQVVKMSRYNGYEIVPVIG